MLTLLGVAGVLALLPTLAISAPQGGPERCAVIDGTGECLVAAADPGRPGGPKDPDRGPAPPRGTAPGRSGTVKPFDPAAEPAVAGLLAGAAIGAPPAAGGPAANGAAAAVTPAVLAQRAVSELTLRPPSIELSTARGAFVGVPVWLWIDRGAATTGPASAVATAGGAQVQATGRLVAVEWRLGPPGAEVRCTGPGTPWQGQAGPSPDCGYVFQQRSLPERTGGTGRWTITATAVWQVGWNGVTDGGPVAGQQTLQLTSTAALSVGEVQVLVSGGG